MRQYARQAVDLLLIVQLAVVGLVLGPSRSVEANHSVVSYSETDTHSVTTSRVVMTYYGEADAEVLARLPDLDLAAIAAAESPDELPALRFDQALRGDAPDHVPRPLAEVVPIGTLPDTLALYSGDWFGPKLRRAARIMRMSIADEQLAALESMAVARSVNTRFLLTIAQVKGAPARYPDRQAWLKWLYLETARVRAALGPFSLDDAATIRFQDGELANVHPGIMSPAAWSLVTILGAGRTATATETALANFRATYDRTFGSAMTDETQSVASAPFLGKPYLGALTGRGYYDHTYPSVDYGGTPNIPGMLDYLGRSNVSYDTHDGDDLWMPYGSAVYAPVSGPVLWNDSQGLLLGYEANTYHIYIGHLSERYVGTGSNVTRGQLIARSGRATVEHIHFEVRHNGKQTDTMGWYGGGADPCPGGGATGSYRGCEESVWLWDDETPPVTGDSIPPSGNITEPSDGSTTFDPHFTITADASDNTGGSGVNRVEFYAYYNADWHALCTATFTPYACVWSADDLPDQAISFTIHVVDNAGNRAMDPGGVRTVTLLRTVPSPPSPPANVTIGATTDASLTLFWQDMAADEDGFQIYIGIWDGTVWTFYPLASVGANVTSFTDGPLSCQADYFYQISAFNAHGESTRSPTVAGTTSPCPGLIGPHPVFLPQVSH